MGERTMRGINILFRAFSSCNALNATVSYLEVPSCGIDLQETAMSSLWNSANVLSHSKVAKAKQPNVLQVLKLSAPSCRILCNWRTQGRNLLKYIQIDYNFHDNRGREDKKRKLLEFRLSVRNRKPRRVRVNYVNV